MKRDWKNYNQELARRGEILIDLEIFNAQAQNKQTKKLGRPFKYPRESINTVNTLFLTDHRITIQTNKGFCKNSLQRSVHAKGFVIVLYSTGIKLTSRENKQCQGVGYESNRQQDTR